MTDPIAEATRKAVWVYEQMWGGSDVFHAESAIEGESFCGRPIGSGQYAPATRETAENVGLRPCLHCYPGTTK